MIFYSNYGIIHLNIILVSFLCVFFAAHIKEKTLWGKVASSHQILIFWFIIQTHSPIQMQFAICILAVPEHLFNVQLRPDISDAMLLFLFFHKL